MVEKGESIVYGQDDYSLKKINISTRELEQVFELKLQGLHKLVCIDNIFVLGGAYKDIIVVSLEEKK